MSRRPCIVTHSGRFHSDEFFAYCILKRIFPNASLLRTRDPIILAERKKDPWSIVIDVGNEYDPESSCYDHHQSEGAGSRFISKSIGEVEYASAGLIWNYYGHNFIRISSEIIYDMGKKTSIDIDDELLEELQEEIHRFIEKDIILGIDANDVGNPKVRSEINSLTISSIISLFNDNWTDIDEDDSGTVESFCENQDFLYEMVIRILEKKIEVVTANFLAKYRIEEASKNKELELTEDGLVVVAHSADISRINPRIISKFSNLSSRFVVVKTASGYSAYVVDDCSDFHHNLKLRFPENWGGLEKDDLMKVSGINLSFCHVGGFVCGASNLEDTISACVKANEIFQANLEKEIGRPLKKKVVNLDSILLMLNKASE